MSIFILCPKQVIGAMALWRRYSEIKAEKTEFNIKYQKILPTFNIHVAFDPF